MSGEAEVAMHSFPEGMRVRLRSHRSKLWRRNEMEGCMGTTHWEACLTCRNLDEHYGCIIKEEIPLSIYLENWILCDDYEEIKS